MQTLNVRAGQTQEEYQAAEERRREDLRAESQAEAGYFFWAAGLAALGTGLLPIRINGIVSVGVFELLRVYGGSLGNLYSLVLYAIAAVWVIVLIGLGFAARSGQRWAFLSGMALYSADMISLIMMFSIWAFGVHAFFLFRWYQGQKALQELQQATP
jgi:hypothetical protein